MSGLVAKVGRRVGRLDVDVAIDTTGGPVVVIGPNGAGKTTTLLLLLGGLRPSTGKITLGERALFDATAGVDVPVELRRIGYVPQGYGLMPHLSVSGHVAFALRSRGFRGGAAALRERAEAHLEELGIGHLAARRIGALSGGERQRLALARALAAEPDALLLDEPLAALDVGARPEVRGHLVALLARLSIPTVMVSHDPEDARALGGVVAVVEGGRVVQSGPVSEVASSPATPFGRAFFR